MAFPSVTYTFTNGTTADGTQVSQNFTDLINGLSDGTKSLNISGLTAAAASTFNAAVTLGSGTANDLTFNGSMASTLNIKTTFSYDLGSTTLGLRDVYFGSADSAARTTKIRGATVASSWTLTLPTTTGTSKYALRTDGSGVSSWAPVIGQTTLTNHGLTLSVSSNILTVALKDASAADASSTSPVEAGMRNGTAATGTPVTRSVTAALSLAISQGSTLGHADGVASYGYVYLIDSDGAGTMKLALSGIDYDEGSVQTTVKESQTGTVTIASPGVWTANSHGMSNNDSVIFTTTGALPTGLSANTKYFIVSAATNTFQVSATPGGTAINTSGTQSGTHTVHVACPMLVSEGNYTSRPVRLLGRFLSTQTTAGTWAASITEIALGNFKLPKVASKYQTTNAQVFGAAAVVAFSTSTTKVYDSFNSFSGNNFVAPKAGRFLVTVHLGIASMAFTNNESITLDIRKNGTSVATKVDRLQGTSTHNYVLSINDVVDCSRADLIDILLTPGTANNPTLDAVALRNWITVVEQ